MFLDEIKSYYGDIDVEAECFINDMIGKYTNNEIVELKRSFFAKFPKNQFPDIAGISKFFDNNKPKNSVYFWSKCDNCGKYFDYKFYTCPHCYRKDKKAYSYKVVKSAVKPPASTIRWNMTWFTDTEKTCLDCENADDGFCPHFGNFEYQCSREQFEYCRCKQCCLKFRSTNRKMSEGKI